jgi:hypothetical protein
MIIGFRVLGVRCFKGVSLWSFGIYGLVVRVEGSVWVILWVKSQKRQKCGGTLLEISVMESTK